MTAELVSVIVPAFQAADFIADALDGVLAQDYPCVEVIVVDDGSTDATAEIARSRAGVRVISQQNRGPAAARNAGIAVASGVFIAALDADDRWPPARLSRQVDFLTRRPDIDVVFGLVEAFIDTESHPSRPLAGTYEQPFAGLLVSGLMRASAFEEVGLFDESLRLAEDVDWLLRATDAGLARATIDETVLYYRLHERNASRDPRANRQAILGALRASVTRKRAVGEIANGG
jgi:glycosyltransferase involved in cell wall biosynthesis